MSGRPSWPQECEGRLGRILWPWGSGNSAWTGPGEGTRPLQPRWARDIIAAAERPPKLQIPLNPLLIKGDFETPL